MSENLIQEWEASDGRRLSAPITEPAATYVELLGRDLVAAANFFLNHAGGLHYVGLPGGEKFVGEPGVIRKIFGDDGARVLANRFAGSGGGSVRIPTCRLFVARALRGSGLQTSEIARKMRASDVAVRGWLKPDAVRREALKTSHRKNLLRALDEAELCPSCAARLRGHAITHANDEKRQPANDAPKGRVVMRLPKAV